MVKKKINRIGFNIIGIGKDQLIKQFLNNMKKCVVLLLFFSTFSLWSQDRNEKLLQGIIAADDALLSGIDVVNLVNEKVTVTNSKGEFSILAKADDILVFSSKSLEMRRLLIDEDDLKSGNITVNMYPKINELDDYQIDDN